MILREAGDIKRSINAFAQSPNVSLIVTGSPAATAHRDLIVALGARNRLPAVYYAPSYCTIGGLMCYGTDFLDQFRRAAGYVDRILRGEKPDCRINRQLSGWIPPPLIIRAFGAHCQNRTLRLMQTG